ncbi:MAG: hypothetical protein HRT57_10640 [Crocinitomicaceae bacterium]|nr:hypothetical protein [Crocinitomicaceae bacterium]
MATRELIMTKQTIAKGEEQYTSGKESVKVMLSEPNRWVDLEVWLDIRSKTELFKTVTIKINFVNPTYGVGGTETLSLKLTTPDLQQHSGLTNDTQELRIPLNDFAIQEMVPDALKDSLINSLELEFDMEGIVVFYYRIKK